MPKRVSLEVAELIKLSCVGCSGDKQFMPLVLHMRGLHKKKGIQLTLDIRGHISVAAALCVLVELPRISGSGRCISSSF